MIPAACSARCDYTRWLGLGSHDLAVKYHCQSANPLTSTRHPMINHYGLLPSSSCATGYNEEKVYSMTQRWITPWSNSSTWQSITSFRNHLRKISGKRYCIVDLVYWFILF